MVTQVDVKRTCSSCGGTFPNTSAFWYAAGKGHNLLMHRGCPVIIKNRSEGSNKPRLQGMSNAELIREFERRKLDFAFEQAYTRFLDVFKQFKPEWQKQVVERLLEEIPSNAR